MSKLSRTTVVEVALEILDEVGLDAVSTRRIAQRLGVEQPSLYWHFPKKADLLTAMAEAALAGHVSRPLPEAGQDWRAWFASNTGSFRTALLAHRDGARLHAGTVPRAESLARVLGKMDFLYASGVPERAAQIAMVSASRFTIGCVLEQQADEDQSATTGDPDQPSPPFSHTEAFEQGLAMLIAGIPAADPPAAG
ncbi:TetR/AcrR family transcriptional regulator C-terminal domain-containing protein [Amycolatopsis sp. PS_44_ISF1]|uniref:TetR/AcrR family transcriptional regulator C-terminal domain-containing protein n=1 Tax=Amycolatopsis sp. PS_44_ISF1 TaxID=2974917 RepID=UPI0028DF5323|nr:TetR/AcrR family transcriptional regulator C-terminal domain-containing protein [Amycolatopsis sp. PS_44_ISF1]MDT8912575.1 TetR/AcrR family transcriptional regulator C-terminal domain-containing protein [Amycolatopsis sp. PS_44_ISF1]